MCDMLYVGSNSVKRREVSRIFKKNSIEFVASNEGMEKINSGKYNPIILQGDLKKLPDFFEQSKLKELHVLVI